jgi:bile acid:Na+ symporter, BASS family
LDYKNFVRKFSSIIIALLAVSLGLLLPGIGLLWHPYTSVILALIMFFVALNIKPKEFINSLRNYKIILFALFLVFFIPPILSIFGMPFFKPVEYAALVIAFGSPAAISSVFWCDVFRGHTPLALIISMVTNILAIVTIPITILLVTQTIAQIDSTAIFTNLIVILVVPLVAAQALRRLLSQKIQRIVVRSPPIQQALVLFLIWGAVSPGAVFVENSPVEFMVLLFFILLILSATFVVAYFSGKRFGRSNAIALSVVSSHKNSTLAIVIGELVLGPIALPALIANLVGQNLFVIPARAVLYLSEDESSEVCL